MENVAVLIHAFPIFALALVAEAFIVVAVRRNAYGWKEALCTVGVALLGKAFQFCTGALTFKALMWFFERRVQTVNLTLLWHWLVLFLAVDFVYYWFHRLSHTVRWFWASHLVHHSSESFRLTNAYRLGWTAAISGAWLMFAPFVWMGVDPRAVGLIFGLNLLYQFWLHTELIGRLGPFERIFNTPSQHRVHHARNEKYLDKNFGGVLCVFDRMFGTYEREVEKCEYGLVHASPSYNPLRVSLQGWAELFEAWRAMRSWKERVSYALSKPAGKEGKRNGPIFSHLR